MTSKCPECDKPLATEDDFKTLQGGQGEHLCWRKYNSDTCRHDPVDWRGRALKAEARADRMKKERDAIKNAAAIEGEEFMDKIADLSEKLRGLEESYEGQRSNTLAFLEENEDLRKQLDAAQDIPSLTLPNGLVVKAGDVLVGVEGPYGGYDYYGTSVIRVTGIGERVVLVRHIVSWSGKTENIPNKEFKSGSTETPWTLRGRDWKHWKDAYPNRPAPGI